MNDNERSTYETHLVRAENRFSELAEKTLVKLDYAMECEFALQAIKKTPSLMDCQPNSFYDTILNVAMLGVTLNPERKLAYLIKRTTKVGSNYVNRCCLDISFLGLVHLAKKYGDLKDLDAVLVYENDEFEVGTDAFTPPLHMFDPFSDERGNFRGGYCHIKRTDGSSKICYMSKDDIEKAKNCSEIEKAKKRDNKTYETIWDKWFGEMAKKTIIKRAFKTENALASNGVLDHAIHILNQNEGYIALEDGSKIVADIDRISKDQVTELSNMINQVKINHQKLYKAFSITTISELPAERYSECKLRLTDYGSKKKELSNANNN